MIFMMNYISNMCSRLSAWFDEMAQATRRCTDCGKNPFTSPPCVKR